MKTTTKVNTKVSFSKRQAEAYKAKAEKADKINRFISNNRSKFTQGATFDAAWLDNKLTWLVPELSKKCHPIKQGLNRMTAYVTLNKALAERGLYIKSSNYYENYKVLTIEGVNQQVNRYYQTAEIKTRAGSCLHKNTIAYKSKWRKLGKRQLSKLINKL